MGSVPAKFFILSLVLSAGVASPHPVMADDYALVADAIQNLRQVEARLATANIRGRYKIGYEGHVLQKQIEVGCIGFDRLFLNEFNEAVESWKVINSQYSFYVVRSKLFGDDLPYELTNLSSRAERCFVAEDTERAVRETLLATYQYQGIYVWELLERHIEVKQAAKNASNGIVRIEFDFRRKSELAKFYSGGALELDPDNAWAITKAIGIGKDLRPGAIIWQTDSLKNFNGFALAKTLSTKYYEYYQGDSVTSQSSNIAEELSEQHTTEDLFRISSYGFSEPNISPSRIWKWTMLVASSFVLFTIVIWQARRRYK